MSQQQSRNIFHMARDAAAYPVEKLPSSILSSMRAVVDSGDVDRMPVDRIWPELADGLMGSHPDRMLTALHACGALNRIMPELDRLWGIPQVAQFHPEIDSGAHTMMVLKAAVDLGAPLDVRWACVMHDLGKGVTPPDVLPRHPGHEKRGVELAVAIAQRLHVPDEIADLASVVCAEHGNIHNSMTMSAEGVFRLLQRCDALNRPERFDKVLQCALADHMGRGGDFRNQPYPQMAHLQKALRAAQSVNPAEVAQGIAERSGKSLSEIKQETVDQAVQRARVSAIEKALDVQKNNAQKKLPDLSTINAALGKINPCVDLSDKRAYFQSEPDKSRPQMASPSDSMAP